MSNKPAENLFSDTSCLEEARPTARYLLNSTTRESYKYGPDGSLTFYVRRIRLAAPGNPIGWPAPDGLFYCVYRVYMPGKAVLNGTWKRPQMRHLKIKSTARANHPDVTSDVSIVSSPSSASSSPSALSLSNPSTTHPIQVIPTGTILHLTPRTLSQKGKRRLLSCVFSCLSAWSPRC